VTNWRVVGSLTRLREQVDALYPGRSKAADGTIGDAAHQKRSSDHNPRSVPALGPVPAVLAEDITHDPAAGCNTYALAEQIRLSRDARVSYVISDRRITGPSHGWEWAPYDGTDPHTGHMHVSVVATAAADSTADWHLTGGPAMGNANTEDLMNRTINGHRIADILGEEDAANDTVRATAALVAEVDDKVDTVLAAVKAIPGGASGNGTLSDGDVDRIAGAVAAKLATGHIAF
jgi:hypothetical protein